MKLLIKGMVCNRCIYVLSEELPKLGLEISDIRLGEVIVNITDKPPVEEHLIINMLQNNGFDLLFYKNQRLVDQIKSVVENGIHKHFENG